MKVPYQLVAATAIERRHEQMRIAISQGYPRLQRQPIDEKKTLSIACYGPSLADTWRTLHRPILSMSGATRFLADRGVIPDYHVDMDPRAHKAKHLEPPVDGVHYLMASVCPPESWEILRGQQVTLWHAYSGRADDGTTTYDWVSRHDPNQLAVHGGSTIGLTAIHVGGVLGYRHFEIHGMDGSFKDTSRAQRHAGPHYGTKQTKDGITWDAGGVTFATSKIMANAVAETLNTLKSFPIFCVFHGDGLTQSLLREWDLPNACRADETEKAATIRRANALFVDMPAFNLKETRTYWDALLADPDPQWLTDVLTIRREQGALRELAKYNTGTIGVETALLLRAASAYYKPKVVAEVGTFIGTSTLALQASEHLYTCDRSNDCLPSAPGRTCFSYQGSTAMLRQIQRDGRKVDLFFFDGRILPQDIVLIHALSHPKTVYFFDDYVGTEKGVVNVSLLFPTLSRHVLANPYEAFGARTTLAALVPVVNR